MEQKKVVIRVVRKQGEERKVAEVVQKEPRPTTKEGLVEWQEAGRKLRQGEKLLIDGKKFYNFAQNIELMKKWFKYCSKNGYKPNDRFTLLIEKDITE